VILRPATLADARGIAGVHVLTWQAAYRDIVPRAHLDALSIDERALFWQESIARGSPELWVAESESQVAGWVAFGSSRDSDAAPNTGEVWGMYVLPRYWGTGTGTGLWCTAQRRLIEGGFTRVTLWVFADNQRAVRFYEALGLQAQPASENEIKIGGRMLKEVRYAMELDSPGFVSRGTRASL